MTSRLVRIELITGAGPAMRRCPECDGTGVLVSDNGPDPTETGCTRCGGSGGQGPRAGRAHLRWGSGVITVLCEECGKPCNRGAMLLRYSATRDEYCCGSYCALSRVYGCPVADELLELARLPLELSTNPNTLIGPVALERAG